MRRFLTLICSISFLFFFKQVSYSQVGKVGIGTKTPDPTSILDIESTTQGVLAPRMTSAQRNAIGSPGTPADGLLVYDTDETAFYYYDNSIWNKLQSQIRDNYKLVKNISDLADELAAGGGSSYLLTPNTYYEINGSITLAAPIDLNEAYISGLDANEDILVRVGGAIFSGASGGGIKNLTLTAPGGSIFGLTGSGAESLVFQNCIIGNSASVGSISAFGVVFMNIIQLVNNTTGITYTNIGNLLLSNVAWFGNNSGTFETYVGTFSLIEKVSGFCSVPAGAVGIDVSANPTVGSGNIISTPFSGAGTYVIGYIAGTYVGYNFSNPWNIESPGLITESDEVATGNLYVSTSAVTNITGANTPIKMAGSTTALNLLRTSSPVDNRLVYIGTKTRYFSYTGSISVTASSNGKRFVFYLAKNGAILPESEQSRKIANGADRGSISLSGVVQLAPNDYVEVWVENINDGTNITAESMNLLIK